MYGNEDLKRFYFQYKTEVLPRGVSIQALCIRNKVPYNILSKLLLSFKNSQGR